MADKMECPGCESYTSGILQAFEEGAPCPVCKLSHDAMKAVLAAQESHANTALTEKFTEAIKRADKLEKENRTLRYRLLEIERALKREPPGWD